MTRRRVLVLGSVAVVAALATMTWLLWPGTAISRENAAKLREGMTLAEVQMILGGPARDETTGPTEFDWDEPFDQCFAAPNPAPGAVFYEWRSDHVSVNVEIDSEARASWIIIRPHAAFTKDHST